MKKLKVKILIISTTILMPAFSLAEKLDFKSVSKNIYDSIITSIVDLLLVAAFVFFAWSIFRFIASEGDRKDQAKDTLFWGVIALFLMASVWGLVKIASETFFKGNLGGNGQEFFDTFKDRSTYDPDLENKN